MVHRVPETEDYEGGYEAATMAGTPRGVAISSAGHGSAEEALANLLGALGDLGYEGTVAVEDATYIGGVRRYETSLGGDGAGG